MNLVRETIAAFEDDDGWVKLSQVGAFISSQTSFDSRNHGYSRLSDLIDAIGLFELKRDEPDHFEVRSNRKQA